MVTVAVIGAGITGLSIAKAVANIPNVAEIKVFEASSRVGGLINTTQKDGYTIEWGIEAFRTTSKSLQKILMMTELKDKIIPSTKDADKRYIINKGKMKALPNNQIGFLTNNVISIRSKLRLLKEPFIKQYTINEESVSQFINRRLGKGFDPLVDAFISGVFAGDHTKISADYGFPQLKYLEKNYSSIIKGMFNLNKQRKKQLNQLKKTQPEQNKQPSLITFPKGMAQIIEQLANGLDITTNSPITSITKKQNHYTLDYNNQSYDADIVVFAHAPNALRKINCVNFENDTAISVDPLNEAKVTVISLGFDKTAFTNFPSGYGVLAPSKEKVFSLGIMFSSNIFPVRAPAGKILVRCFVGGIRQPEKALLEDDQLLAGVLNDLKTLLKCQSDPEMIHVARNAGIPQIELGHNKVLAYKSLLEKNNKGIFIGGIGWTGISTERLIDEADGIKQKIQEYMFSLSNH